MGLKFRLERAFISTHDASFDHLNSEAGFPLTALKTGARFGNFFARAVTLFVLMFGLLLFLRKNRAGRKFVQSVNDLIRSHFYSESPVVKVPDRFTDK